MKRAMSFAVLRPSLLVGAILASGAACGQTVAAPAKAASAAASGSAGLAKELALQRQEQDKLLAEVRAHIARTAVDDPIRAQKLRLLAAIEKRIADEDPLFSRRRYLSNAMQGGPVFHDYCLAMRHRIEERGTGHFPMQDGHKLYGHVVANLTIDASGRLVARELVRGSGDATLDAQALAIATAAAPFGAFTPAMRKQADQIVYTASFNFVHDGDASAGKGASAP